MKKKLPALHTQILLALLFGALFGAFFNVNDTSVVVSHLESKVKTETTVSDWSQVLLIKKGIPPLLDDTLRFGPSEKPKLISSFKTLKKSGADITMVYQTGEVDKAIKSEETTFNQVKSIRNEKTPATWIKWLGDIFIRLLNLVAIPLVLASLIAGAASLGDIRKFARIGTKTLSYYLVTTAFAVIIGLTLANIIQPGERMNEGTKNNLLQT
ncbi:MAG: cation:dicarboxylase symporter family transporter [Ignavibacteriaceae bacterium]|nr:cation:dicarboxylase symporter family transporter [Ignavibacteriaceae bacterium]